MLKLPGVGTALNSFMHVSVIGHGMLELAIIYKTTNAYGVTIHKMQNYEIYSDDRHPNIQNIKAIIDSLLSRSSCGRYVPFILCLVWVDQFFASMLCMLRLWCCCNA